MFSRRSVLLVACQSIALKFFNHGPAFAQDANPVAEGWGFAEKTTGTAASALQGLLDKAAGFGISRPKALGDAALEDSYDTLLPVLVDLIDELEASNDAKSAAPLADLIQQSTELLGSITFTERAPEIVDDEKAVKYIYDDLRADYVKLFETCEIRPERLALVKWYVQKINSPKYRALYEEVGSKLAIPWYFIGITHSLEAGFNFSGHLHNGDPLRGRTFQVPAGRPPVWNPPNDWPASATDALTLKKFNDQPDWSVGQLLYRWEKYNGFGNRRQTVTVDGVSQPVNTPYLWSFSRHYTKGKYVRDGKWNPEAVSKQCGAAVILKELIAQNIVAEPVK